MLHGTQKSKLHFQRFHCLGLKLNEISGDPRSHPGFDSTRSNILPVILFVATRTHFELLNKAVFKKNVEVDIFERAG